VIQQVPESSARADNTYSSQLRAIDVDGNALTYSIENAPGWLVLDAGSGLLSGFPSKTDYGKHDDIVITVSDGQASTRLSFSLEVLPPPLGRDNFTPLGGVTPTDEGYQATGTLVMTVDGKEQRFENSNLLLSFDEEGNLLDMAGETIVPPEVSDTLSLDAGLTAIVGTLSGREINANPDFDITLKEDIRYIVYYFAAGLDVGISTGQQRDGTAPETLTLSTPLGGEILLILDPYDPMYYYFADVPLIGNAGKGVSVSGFIPFVPDLDYAELGSFDGHLLDKAEMGIGIKIFDFFTLSGERVIDLPIPGTIDYDDLFASPVDFNMGFNGAAAFSFSILGIGLFDFDIASSSATLEVSAQRQQMAMQTVIAPDVSWQPSWFTILPTTEIVGNWSIDGSGAFSAELTGDYESTMPAAAMSGRMRLDNNGASFGALIPDAKMPLEVSATFGNQETTFFVDAEADISGSVAAEVNQAFDEIVADKLQAFNELKAATENYEFEVSLRGFRQAIPGIADAVVSVLNGLPDSVASTVRSKVHDEIKSRQRCIGIGSACVNVPSNSAINDYADDARDTARSRTASAIVPYRSAMQELKRRALEADDDQLRDALERALRAVYSRRTYSNTITVTINLPSPIPDYTHTERVSRNILTPGQAAQVLTAANNVQFIQATSDIKISAEEIFDQIPVEDAINTARQEVNDGLKQIPRFDGAGMTVSGGSYSAFILLDGVEYGIDDVNILDPADLLAGITKKVATVLSGGR
jgi:hypothetical protein